MLNKIKIQSIVIILILCSFGCTSNVRTRVYGGKQVINLQKGKKLITVDWDGSHNLWILTRPMRENESAETFSFEEKSSFGLMQGEIVLIEGK